MYWRRRDFGLRRSIWVGRVEKKLMKKNQSDE